MAKSTKRLAAGYHAAVAVKDLTPYPRNPRIGDLPAIAESILTNGWYGCVVAQCSTGYVLAGNHSLRAAVEQGAATVPVYALNVDDKTARALLLADNKIADRANYDNRQLDAILQRILADAETLIGTGWTDADAKRLHDQLADVEAANPSDAEEADDSATDEPPTFRLVIQCRDEAEQKKLLRLLVQRGLDPRASVA